MTSGDSENVYWKAAVQLQVSRIARISVFSESFKVYVITIRLNIFISKH